MGVPKLEVLARAKVNLTLHVLGRRADGYHELDSLITFADYGDRLIFSPAAGLELALSGPFAHQIAESPEINLALRAAHGLAERFPRAAGVRIALEKRLPVAAGLGGGSADAAAVLTGLNAFRGLGASAADLTALGATLGADVPACVAGRTCRVTGLGEIVTPLPPLPPAWLVLVNPGEPLETARVFGALNAVPRTPAPDGPPPADFEGLIGYLEAGVNHLEAPARALAPAIGAVLQGLSRQAGCRLSRMSGSGATCYGLFAGAAAAAAAGRALARAEPAWWVVTAPLSRA